MIVLLRACVALEFHRVVLTADRVSNFIRVDFFPSSGWPGVTLLMKCFTDWQTRIQQSDASSCGAAADVRLRTDA
jgi:hypothetical protein